MTVTIAWLLDDGRREPKQNTGKEGYVVALVIVTEHLVRSDRIPDWQAIEFSL
jgi:hypothetical protein